MARWAKLQWPHMEISYQKFVFAECRVPLLIARTKTPIEGTDDEGCDKNTNLTFQSSWRRCPKSTSSGVVALPASSSSVSQCSMPWNDTECNQPWAKGKAIWPKAHHLPCKLLITTYYVEMSQNHKMEMSFNQKWLILPENESFNQKWVKNHPMEVTHHFQYAHYTKTHHIGCSPS